MNAAFGEYRRQFFHRKPIYQRNRQERTEAAARTQLHRIRCSAQGQFLVHIQLFDLRNRRWRFVRVAKPLLQEENRMEPEPRFLGRHLSGQLDVPQSVKALHFQYFLRAISIHRLTISIAASRSNGRA